MDVLQKIAGRTSQKMRRLRGGLSHFTGADKRFYARARGSRILCYHGVCQSHPTKFNSLFITKETFEQHLQYYMRYFNMVSLDDYYKQNFSNNKFNICLTFDDGFANNYHYVLPLLERYEVPATFFVTGIGAAGYDILWNDMLSIAGLYGPESFTFEGGTYRKNKHRQYCNTAGQSLNNLLRQTGFGQKAELLRMLDKTLPFRRLKQETDYWLQMSAEEITRASRSPFVTIGAHGYYHNDLAGISAADAAKEMADCKYYLEGLTGKAENSIAFPYGSYNANVTAAAKQCGYTQLLTVDIKDPADHNDVSLRERLTINPFISITNQLYANINGAY
ncbi:polysaccharide deacetylase family protein [Mucilaginibacter pedocola]|uniref:NodB homology domain-containing protein n=1 Tax=Mucilaginibacter pedocola TaxID=1792845 RepID=A0A1S9P8G9_9SPHI|nr:polysaccharide deacetylase family protein [Mucilaginibacter pedocola]OOQ57270.1 hypothetical protein BC343_14230 [Mucilaginibacter pedocola]